jgi:hypothetical protein
MPEQGDLSGVVLPGKGLGVGLVADRTVTEKLQELTGFPVVPGTLKRGVARTVRTRPELALPGLRRDCLRLGRPNRPEQLLPRTRDCAAAQRQ